MNEQKLVKLLKKTPALPKVGILITAIFATITYSLIFTSDKENLLGAAGLGIVIAPVVILILAACIRKLRASKVNGTRTLRYLRQNGLLEKAADEYFSSDGFCCRIISTSGRPDKFVNRDNALTSGFLFAMSDNTIVPYSDLKAAGIMKVDYSVDTVSHTQFIVFAETIDNRRIDIHGIDNDCITPEQQKIIDAIFDRIAQSNPDCEINRAVIKG